MSAAHVSGLMGMLWAKNYTAISNQTMSMQDLKDIVVKSAQDFNTNDYSVYNSWGSGVINAHEALMEPHPNLSLRKYWIGTNDYDYPLPDNTLVWNLPSMEWGSSQAIKLRIKNKWAQGSNVSIELSTTDPNITFSYPGENDSYGFGTIAAETTVDTANMWIWDWSNQVRHNVPITITISANGMPDRIYTVYMNILQSTSAIVASIDMLPGETFSTDLVVSNLGTGNEDELIVGTSAGRLFCYRNNTWNHIGTLPQGVSVNPAVGDINADGYKEIVSIDSSGNVHVYDRFFTQMRTYPCFSNEITVGNVIMEDITGDNILDIIYATKRSGTSTQDAGVRIIDFINNTQLSYLSNLVILAAPAVGDVDHIPGYEIVVPYSNSNGFFCFKVLKYYEGILVASIEHTEQLAIESVISPIIVDINEDLSREIAFQLSYPNGSSSLIYYSIPESGFIYGGDFLGRVSLFSEVVKLNDLSSDVAIVSSDVSTLMGLQYDVRISNGMVGSDEFSLAYISTDSQVKSLIVDQLLPPEAGYLPKQIVIMTANIITYTKLRTNPSNPSS
ncbi:MAG: hypothetical protein PHY48_17270, partial [Candidatus Cloacimonetes bacterium]|nr:hypothetical protein [Candidatus Cloacimonadota bacterium]